MNPLSQFVVDSLVPDNRSEQGRAYQLNDTSVSPIRIVGYENGIEIEETICALAKSAKFVDRDGNICDVPLRTGRVLSNAPEAVLYEQILVTDLIRQGQIPLEACPHTTDFRSIVGRNTPLVKPPEGYEGNCPGSGGAQTLERSCIHMQKLIKERREASALRASKEDEKLKQMKPSDVAALVKELGEAFGESVTTAMAAGKGAHADARKNLREGKGEKVE
jgi:hypothetical protein